MDCNLLRFRQKVQLEGLRSRETNKNCIMEQRKNIFTNCVHTRTQTDTLQSMLIYAYALISYGELPPVSSVFAIIVKLIVERKATYCFTNTIL